MTYSVIIPTQNRPEMLGRALRSVYAQTVPAREIIVVDDASSPALVLPPELRDDRVRIIRHEKAAGGAAARNAGLELATSDTIAFLDDDDEWHPPKMEKQLAYFAAHPEVGLVSCGHLRIEAGSIYHEVFTEEFVRRHAHYDNFFGSFSFLTIKRSAHRLDPALPALQDWDFVLTLTQDSQSGVLEEALVNYYGHDLPRITTRRMNRVKGLRRCYLKHRPNFTRDERRWWMSQILFERAAYIADLPLRRAQILWSIRLASTCRLPWKMKLRSLGRKAASLFLEKRQLVAIRSACLSGWQRFRSQFSLPIWMRRTGSAS